MDFQRECGEHVRFRFLLGVAKKKKKNDAPGEERAKKGTYRERPRHRSPDRVGSTPVEHAGPDEPVPEETFRGSELFTDAPSVQHVAGGGRVPTEKLQASRAAHRTDRHLGESSSREVEKNSVSVEQMLRSSTTEGGESSEQRYPHCRKRWDRSTADERAWLGEEMDDALVRPRLG